jgi:hypothetical protein
VKRGGLTRKPSTTSIERVRPPATTSTAAG